MQGLLDRLHPTAATRGDWFRNIVSLRESEDLFDDLADDADTRALLAGVEMDRKPPQYAGAPGTSRPFEESEITEKILAAIDYPFRHPTASRFSDGTWGVWYGASTIRTTACETAFHWHRRFIEAPLDLAPAGPVEVERRVLKARCGAALLDLRPVLATNRSLVDPDDWTPAQRFGRLVHESRYPGLLSLSVRATTANARTVAVFDRDVLSRPRDVCYLSYRFEPEAGDIRVMRQPGRTWFRYRP